MQPGKFSKPAVTSIKDHTKDLQIAILRKSKFLRNVQQFNESENVPMHLINRFSKTIKVAKTLKSLNIKWSYLPGIQNNPEVVKSICKIHSQNLKEFNILVLYLILPYSYRNLYSPLKSIKTLTFDSNKKGLKKLPVLRTIKNLYIDLRYEAGDYALLHKSLCRLPNLTKLYILCVPKALIHVLSLFDRVTTTKDHSIEFQVATEGEQPQSKIPQLHENTGKRIMKMSLRYVHSSSFLEELFGRTPFNFQHLKALKLDFKNTEPNIIKYLKYLKSIAQLEDLILCFDECPHKSFSSSLLEEFGVPSSVKNLELKCSISLRHLVSKNNQTLLDKCEDGLAYRWRYVNIFEEEACFKGFFQAFEETKNLETLNLEFDLLEDFNLHYTNFFVSIIKRLSHISSISFQVNTKPIEKKENAEKKHGCFALSYFLKNCSKLEQIKDIEIFMPNFLFDDIEVQDSLKCLESLIIKTIKQEGKNSIKFTDISHNVAKLLKALYRNSPNINRLVFEFYEVLDQVKLLDRFYLLKQFKNLHTFCGKFSVEDCDSTIVKQIGKIFKSLIKLTNLKINFLDSSSNLEALEEFVKYHKSLRNIFISFNGLKCLDNDCIIDTLRCHLKGADSDGSYSMDSDIFDEEDDGEGDSENVESDEEMDSPFE